MKSKVFIRILLPMIILGLCLIQFQSVLGNTNFPSKERSDDTGLLEAASIVSGAVSDGGVPGFDAHGYPLYARINITGPSFEQTIYTNPITGAYSVDLEEGIEYTFTIEAYAPGYQTLVQTLTPTGGSLTKDFNLQVDPLDCNAPGYHQDYDIFYDFDDTDHGFTPGGVTSFAWGEITSGPITGHSGSKGLATNLSGAYNANESGYILSPLIDLSTYGDDTIVLQWWDWKHIEQVTYDSARVEATQDGGATWEIVWGPVGGMQDTAYSQQTAILNPIYNVSNFQFRFFFESDDSLQYDGWYIDDIGILSVPFSSTTVFSNDFDTDDGGFTSSGANVSWAWGNPTSGPGTAHTSPNVWGTNIDVTNNEGKYNNSEASFLTSPLIDLSPYSGQMPILTFYHWNEIEHIDYDWGSVEVSKDGGSTWQDVSGKIGDVTAWTLKRITLDPAYGVSNFQFRFHFQSDGSINDAGWYIDDVTVDIAEPVILSGRCTPTPGGVAAGFVYDQNTGIPLLGADVLSPTTNTQSTQWENDQEHAGLYWFFEPTQTDPESVGIEVSKPLYKNQSLSLNVVQSVINHQDFYLGAADLNFDPIQFTIPMTIGDPPENHTLRIENTGGKDATYSLSTVDLGYDLPLDQEFLISRSITEEEEFPYETTGAFAVQQPTLERLSFLNSNPNWLSINPSSGTIMAYNSQDIILSLDPASLGQPGEYQSEILIEHDTPYSYANIPVTLQLAAPSDWGRIKGTVSGMEICDLNPANLAGTTLAFWQGEDLAGSIETTETGYYTYSLPNGTYDILISKAGYSDILVEDVYLGSGATLTQDFSLRLLAPCLSVDPVSIEQTILIGKTSTQILTISNTGAGEAAFELLESGEIQDAMVLYESFENEGWMPPEWETFHFGNTSKRWTTVDDPKYVYEGDYAAWIRYDDILNSDEWLLSSLIDTTLLTNLNLSFMAFSSTEYPGATMKLWITDENGTPLTTSPHWDLIRDESWPELGYRAVVIPLTEFNHYGSLRLAWQYVGLDGESFGLDLVQLTGSFDIPWLTPESTSGLIPPDSEIEISIGFDAYDLDPGDYDANLSLNSAPDPLINIPVIFHVELGPSPYVYNIPDQSIVLGESFVTIALDDYVVDGDHTDEQINWTVTGNTDLIVTIDANRVATITYPADWTGSETLTFTARDPDGHVDSDTATFTVVDSGEDFQVFLPLILK